MAARLAPLEPPYPDDLAAELASTMPPGMPPIRLFRTLARNRRVFAKLRAANLLDRGALTRRQRELLILRTTARCGSEYEWGVHVSFFAERVGVGETAVRASVHGGPDTPGLDDDARLLFRLVDALHDAWAVDDALWQVLAARYGEEELIEALALVGFYHTIACYTQALRLPNEPGAPRFADV